MADWFQDNKWTLILLGYLVLFAVVLFFSSGSKISPTGNIILSGSVPKAAFDQMIYTIIAFAVGLGILLHLSVMFKNKLK